MKKLSRVLAMLLALCMVLAILPSSFAAEPLTTEVVTIEKYGNLDLKVTGSELLAYGLAYGDIITVEVNGKTYDMPVGTNYSDVDNGLPICRVVIDEESGKDYVVLAINMGDLATTAGIATKTKIEEDPGYRWDYNEGVTVPVVVKITLKEAGGYYDEWLMRQLTRTNVREDYPDLSDAEFANFRVIATQGMGKNILYRSSSPVNPELGRNTYADAAMREAGVKTVMNLADTEAGMKAYEGYEDSYYATAKVIPLNLGVDFTAAEFKAGLKEGFLFIASNEGPYLVHCNEGKDRAGFVSALLECLMGATADEVIADYMVTYYNYYGVEPGTEQYQAIAKSNIMKSLATAFDIADITAEEVDLAAEAEAFLKEEVGMTEEEIAALKASLGKSYLADSDEIVIYYTNDVHTYIDGGLSYDNIADLKAQTASQAKGVLLFDAGDHVQGTAYGSMDKGKTIIALMNAAGYDLATLGNHEFDYGMERALEIIEEADFPYVSCNFYHEDHGMPTSGVLDGFKIFEVGGKKIAVVGITTPESFTKSTPKYFQNEKGEYIYGISGGTDGKELYGAVQAAVDAAKRNGADYVIALGHCGDDPASKPWTSEEVIANTTGIDAFIDGHSHSTVPMKEVADKEGNTVVLTQTGSYFDAIGRMSITEDGIKTELIREYTGSDKDVAEIKNDWIAEIDTMLGEVIGHTALTFDNYDKDGNRLVRKQETNTGDFAADALYYLFDNMDLDVDLAIMNGGGVRNKAITGDISYKTCKEIHTFGNVACLITVTGQQILDALEWGARDVGTAECGGFLQVSGVSYEIHTYIPNTVQKDEKGVWTGGPTGEYRVKNVMIGGEPLDPEKTYNLAGYNYTLRDLGDGYAMFDGAVNVLDYVMEDYMVLANYVQSFPEKDGKHEIEAENSVLGANYAEVTGEGRITVVTEKPDDKPFENKFTDVKEDAWYYAYVMKMAAKGVIIGMTETTFEPESNLTRGQMVVMLYRVAGEPEVEGYSTFTDVPKDEYYAKAVAWAQKEGVVNGTSETTFEPEENVTREQMITMFHRLEEKEAGTGDLSKFKDANKVAEYAVEAMKWAVGKEIINGTTIEGDKNFYLDPQGLTTRAQAAKVFCIWMELYVTE